MEDVWFSFFFFSFFFFSVRSYIIFASGVHQWNKIRSYTEKKSVAFMYLFKIIILLPTLRHLNRKINLLLPSHFAPVCLLTQNSNKGGLASSSVSSLSSTGVMSSGIGCTPKTVAPLSSSVSSLSPAGEMSSRLGGTSKTLASVTSSATWKKRIQTLCVCVCVCVCVWDENMRI